MQAELDMIEGELFELSKSNCKEVDKVQKEVEAPPSDCEESGDSSENEPVERETSTTYVPNIPDEEESPRNEALESKDQSDDV